MNKYEQLIEHIINDNEQAARELFHQIVVAKSRDIYESLMDEELGGNQSQNFVQDVQDDVEQDQQGLGEEDEEGEEIELGGDDDSMDGDDEGDDFGADDDMGDDLGDEGSVEDRVMDLESELDALKAEFEQLLGGGSDDMGGDDMGDDMGSDMDDDMGGDDMGGDMEDEGMGMMETAAGSGSGKSGSGSGSGMMEAAGKSGSGVSGSGKSSSGKSGSGKSGSGNPFAKKGSGSGKMESRSQAEIMKEYVNKVKDMYKGDQGEGHEVGTGGSVNVNKTSITDNMKNDMGGSASNIVAGGAESDPTGTPPAKTSGVLKQGGEIDVAKRNVNKVGGNAGAQNFFSKKETSWEKAKGKEGQTTDGSVPVAKDSLLKARK